LGSRVGLGAVGKLAELGMAGTGAADRMAVFPSRCPLTTRSPRAPWRRRRAAGLAAGLALFVPSIGLAQGIVEPGNGSLAPIDREAFRQQYGQEGLFRLRLGLDAAEQPAKAGAGAGSNPQPCPAATWAGSLQKQRYDAAMSLRKYYAAGEALGEWRRLCPAGP
jgi:hypothetical protein